MVSIESPRPASYLIGLAKKDPRYLAEGGTPYLCHILFALEEDKKITWAEIWHAKRAITAGIDGRIYLRVHLHVTGVISHSFDERSPEYSQAAHAFWDALIEKLQVAGN